MRTVGRFAGCIVRWGGGGGAMLGALLYFLWLVVALVSDIARRGSWPYYDLNYVLLGLLGGAIIGFILGILIALINGVALGLLMAILRPFNKRSNPPRTAVALTFILISGLGTLAYLANLPEVYAANGWPHIGWLGAGAAALLAACWGWLVSEKARLISLQH